MALSIFPGAIRKSSSPAPTLSKGAAVEYSAGGVKRLGVFPGCTANGAARVKHAVLAADARAFTTHALIDVDAAAVKAAQLECHAGRVVVGDALHRFTGGEGTEGVKGVAIKNESGLVVDYTSVTIKGYASTFVNTDRQGDAVQPGAFRDTIKTFMNNPVMLIDHRNSVEHIAGRYTVVREDNIGLYVEGSVSDAPELRPIRFRLMEGSLQTLSIGGIWFFDPSGRNIEKVHLFEISLVAVPANPEARISARSVEPEAPKRMLLSS